jgi:hypothetical protein
MKLRRYPLIAAAALLALAAGAAHARTNVSLFIGIGAPLVPVVVTPAPVYYAAPPPTVYVRPAPVVYYAPAPVYYGPPGKWKHRHKHYRRHY